MPTPKDHALTDAIIAKAAKREGVFKLTDGNGLMLDFHNPNGTPTWRVRYMQNREDVRTKLGTWPEMSLEQARAACKRFRKAQEKGLKPAAEAPKAEAPKKQWVAQQVEVGSTVLTVAEARALTKGVLQPADTDYGRLARLTLRLLH